jgi:hypothetical protein
LCGPGGGGPGGGGGSTGEARPRLRSPRPAVGGGGDASAASAMAGGPARSLLGHPTVCRAPASVWKDLSSRNVSGRVGLGFGMGEKSIGRKRSAGARETCDWTMEGESA